MTEFKTYPEFWPFYVSQHLNPICRILHYIGTSVAILLFIHFIRQEQYLQLPLTLIPGYACAWIGHFIFEKNRPATFKYPVWSFISDFVMLYYFLTGQMKNQIARPDVLEIAKASPALQKPLKIQSP